MEFPPLQEQVPDLSASVSERLDRVERQLKDHDVKIFKLEKMWVAVVPCLV